MLNKEIKKNEAVMAMISNNSEKKEPKTLKSIINKIKEIGRALNPGKIIRVGETFDPGPEFAISDFKYNRHRECCRGGSMGTKSMVCCYAELNADDRSYAAFPDGIPQGTRFGTFFGKQAQRFLGDMGFDYIWFSNGLGFGVDTWESTGVIFNGKSFDTSKFDDIREKISGFWRDFKNECPDYPIETRGTNLSAAIDLASDGVPLMDIYETQPDILPPPNSPWAALDGDYGLELCGYMSRMAHLPGDKYLFRYYIHDPWWMNSPWQDRYEGMPHDIYLPLAISRLNEAGEVKLPTHFNVLSIDNSLGEMPENCILEPIAHIKKALRYAPDKISPILWVYPFREYHQNTDEADVMEMFFGDWFIRGAINHGLALSSVISTDNFNKSFKDNPDIFEGIILISVVPIADSEYEQTVFEFIKHGGKVIFYGSTRKASDKFKSLVNIKEIDSAGSGEMRLSIAEEIDTCSHGHKSDKLLHRPITCGGEIKTVLSDEKGLAKPLAYADKYTVMTASKNVIWLRGTCSAQYNGGRLLAPDSEDKYYSGESLMRYALHNLDYSICFDKKDITSKEPVIMLHRHENAYMFSLALADTSVGIRMKFPLGSPILLGAEAFIDQKGYSNYHFGKWDFKECRIFIEQTEAGVIGCHEIAPVSYFHSRRIKLTGLKNATVRFLPPDWCKNDVHGVMNSKEDYFIVGDDFNSSIVTQNGETYYEAKSISGEFVISIPFEHPLPEECI